MTVAGLFSPVLLNFFWIFLEGIPFKGKSLNFFKLLKKAQVARLALLATTNSRAHSNLAALAFIFALLLHSYVALIVN